MALEWGGERVMHKSMQSASYHGGPFPSNVKAGNGPRGEGDSEGVVRQQLRLKATPKHPQGKGKRERNNKRKTRW